MRTRRCLIQILMMAAVIAGPGLTPGAAQDAPQPGPTIQGTSVPAAAVVAKSGEPEAAVPPAAPGNPGRPVATPEVPTATPAQIPPAPDAVSKKPHDFTPMGMFLSAGPVVQAVMIVLAGASIMTWIILLARGSTLLLEKRRMSAVIVALREANGLADAAIQVRGGIGARLLLSTDEEVFKSQGLPNEGIKERALMILQRIEAGAARRMAVGTGILATIGSIGPFVGLLGTVWGIMSSFIGIADSNTTSLAVVAPGIAEALLATGIGLAAAIPAVVIYNALARSVTGYRAMVADAVALIMSHLSRDLDRREAISHGTNSKLRLAGA